MNQRFIHATLLDAERLRYIVLVRRTITIFCYITCGLRSVGDFFLCQNPGTECHIVGQQEIKAFFFSQNSQKILFSLQNSLFLAKTAVFLRKIEGPSGFLHFRGVLPPCLHTKLAVCTEKCVKLRTFRAVDARKNRISHVLMVYLFCGGIKGLKQVKKVLTQGQMLQKSTYNARTKCANVQRSFSLLKGAFFLRNGLKCDIIMGVAGGLLQSFEKVLRKGTYVASARSARAWGLMCFKNVLLNSTYI